MTQTPFSSTVMKPFDSHPDLTVLREFVEGRLDEPGSNDIEAHLQRCDTCCHRLKELPSTEDEFLNKLRAATHAADTRGLPGSQPELPRRVGRFEVRQIIGEGGFGVVLLAHDPQLKRDVAIKIPRFGLFVPASIRERFLHEARAAAGLDHPNIVPVFETGEDAGVCYIASAYCRGPTLAEWLRQRGAVVPFRVAAWIVAELATGVHHAHVRGVLHRDLKPSNVLLEPCGDAAHGRIGQGAGGLLPAAPHSRQASPAAPPELDTEEGVFPFVPRISDFGLARIPDTGGDGTRSNVVMGTAAYMSPEQARGKTRLTGPESDVYSLGAMLYELSAGRPPLVGENELDTLQRLQTEEPIPLRHLRPKTPRNLETICLKCLQKDSQRRYSSAQQLADDLRSYLSGRPIQARPTGAVETAALWCRRNPALAALASGLCAALILVAVVSTAMSIRLRQEALRTSAAERASKVHLWESYLATAAATRRSGIEGRRLDNVDIIAKAAALAVELRLDDRAIRQLRDEAVACFALTDLRLRRKVSPPGMRLDPHRVAVDASLKRAALIDKRDAILLLGLDGGQNQLALPSAGGAAQRVAVSPDGRFVAALVRQQNVAFVTLWQAQQPGANPERIAVADATCLAFSAAGDALCIASADGGIWAFDLASMSLERCCAAELSPRDCCFDPSGKQVAVWGDSRLAIADLHQKRIVRLLTHSGDDQVQTAAFSPNGRWLVTGGSHHLVYAWHARQAQPMHVLKGHQGWVTNVEFAPDSSFVATASSDGTTRLWEYWTGRELLVAKGYALGLGRDGRTLAGLFDSGLALFDVAVGLRKTGQSSDHGYETEGFDIDPDCKLTASLNYDGVRLWDCATAQEVGRLDSVAAYWARFRRSENGLAILWGSSSGVQSTPLRLNAVTGQVEIGTAWTIPVPQVIDCPQQGSLSAAGRRLCVHDGHGDFCVVDPDDPTDPVLIHHAEAGSAALSADGRWVATFSRNAPGLKVWSAQSGERAAALLEQSPIHAASFSPAGDFLVVNLGRELVSLAVGKWREVTRLTISETSGIPSWSSDISFAADGKLLAVSSSGYEIKLVQPHGLKLLVTLPAEFPHAWLSISADGSRLACTGPSGVLHLWDLAATRTHLKAARIDW